MAEPRAHLILGGDAWLVEASADDLVRAALPNYKKGDFGLETINGLVDKVDDAVAALRAVRQAMMQTSFFAEDKVVWLRNVSFCGTDRTSRSETVRAEIESFRTSLRESGIPDGITLLVSGTAIARNCALVNTFKQLEKAGTAKVVDVGNGGPASAKRILAQVAKSMGRTIGAEAISAFVDRVGTDGQLISSEAAKLFTYVGDAEPTVEDVAAICAFSPSGTPWELADAFGARDLPRVLNSLKDLFSVKAEPIFLLTVLENRINELALAVDARERNLAPGGVWSASLPEEDADAVSALGKFDVFAKPPFQRAPILAQATRWNKAQVMSARLALVKAHEDMVTVSTDAAAILEIAVSQALSR